MESDSAPTPIAQRELALQRTLRAPREKLFRCWTDPQLMTQWFTPPPWKTVRAEVDLRAGGRSCITMLSPEGEEFPNRGIYLDVVPNAKLVFTDAFVDAWEPSEKAFMVAALTFEDAGDGRTLYTARVQHWSAADREAHEKMGFHEGWGIATQQLEALAQRI